MSSESAFRSQFGEDRLLAAQFAHHATGYYLEVGAHDGMHLSNTFYFEQIGWTGMLIEPDPEMARVCARQRPRSRVVQCAAAAPGSPARVPLTVALDARDHSSVGFDALHWRKLKSLTTGARVSSVLVPARTLDSLLEEAPPPRIDFVTIDVEGHEWEVLQGFNLARWRPTVVILERNRRRPDGRVLVHMHRQGYLYERTTGVNDWFRAASHASARAWGYRLGVLRRLYVPWMTGMALAPARWVARRALRPLGLLDHARAWRTRGAPRVRAQDDSTR